MTKTQKKTTRKPLTKMQKRVLVAKDVLKAINTKQIKPEQGAYMSVETKSFEDWVNKLDLKETSREILLDGGGLYDLTRREQNLLPTKPIKMPKHCEVCAIGSLFVATVDRFDKLKLGNAIAAVQNNDDVMIDHLDSLFTKNELRVIEAIFEDAAYILEYSYNNANAISTVRRTLHVLRRKGPTARLIWLMENIIKNKGYLVLEREDRTMQKTWTSST